MTLFSTYSLDKYIAPDGSIIKEQIAGPAYYLSNALKKEGEDYICESLKGFEVDILVTKNGEFGKINKKVKKKKIKFNKISTPNIIISTILDEFDLTNINKYDGKIFIDIQGYVRDGSKFGKKKHWSPIKKNWKYFECLKGTSQEMKYVPQELFNQQKKKLLIITNANKGSIIYAYGRRYNITQKNIIFTKDTVGAGDSFFAAFISKYTKTANPKESAEYATKKTSEFLKAKNTQK